ncbi:MAG TPA: TraB/GumN family protein [Steroidobacteraceae bacterium]|nr:TraB/GumN family protein [Steroidobacteraceae bacterium]
MDRTASRWLFALGLLGSLTAQAGSPVWAIRGAHNTVYLAGSVHLLRAADAALPPGFERAYTDSARVVMELDLGKLDELATAEWMLEHGSLPADANLRGVLGDTRYQRVSAAAATLGLPPAALDREAPWVVGLQLAQLEYVHLGFDPGQGVEQQLLQRAQADHKPTAGLESVSEELGVFEAMPPAEQAHFLDMVLDDLDDTDTEMRTVLGAWRGGDAARLAALLAREYRSFPALYRALVTDRNGRWLPEIERLLRGTDNSLVVVGALHLVGDGGLLEALRRDGFAPVELE